MGRTRESATLGYREADEVRAAVDLMAARGLIWIKRFGLGPIPRRVRATLARSGKRQGGFALLVWNRICEREADGQSGRGAHTALGFFRSWWRSAEFSF